MKSLAMELVMLKYRSSNSNFMAMTFLRVSSSVSPWNGDKPLSLQAKSMQHKSLSIMSTSHLIHSDLSAFSYFSLGGSSISLDCGSEPAQAENVNPCLFFGMFVILYDV